VTVIEEIGFSPSKRYDSGLKRNSVQVFYRKTLAFTGANGGGERCLRTHGAAWILTGDVRKLAPAVRAAEFFLSDSPRQTRFYVSNMLQRQENGLSWKRPREFESVSGPVGWL